jgi:hypothetical protein
MPARTPVAATDDPDGRRALNDTAFGHVGAGITTADAPPG